MKAFKIVRIEHKDIKKDFSFAEKMLADYAADGWNVVSAAPDLAKDLRGDLLVTLEKET